MNNMNMSQMDAFMAPLWVVYALSAFFFAGSLFYLYRLLRPGVVKSVYGYYDWQNEVGHGLCTLAMAFALAPSALQLPSEFWAVVLTALGAFFLVRAVTWGRKLPYNKWWWDWAHVGMLFGMATMFLPVALGPLNYVLELFWLWFAGLYVYELCMDLHDPKPLYLGSDIAHLTMGAVMFIMTVAPMALMAPSMPGMICSGSTPPAHHDHGSGAATAPGTGGMDMKGMAGSSSMPGMEDMHHMHDMHHMQDMPGMPGMDMSNSKPKP